MDEQKDTINLTEVVNRLNLIIALLLDRDGETSRATTTSRIMRLSELGASPSLVAQILNKPLSNVTASMAMKRKRGGAHRE
jgi:hypothetical protein